MRKWIVYLVNGVKQQMYWYDTEKDARHHANCFASLPDINHEIYYVAEVKASYQLGTGVLVHEVDEFEVGEEEKKQSQKEKMR